MFENLSPTEIIIIGLIIILLFGGREIPEFFKNLGKAIKKFWKAFKGK